MSVDWKAIQKAMDTGLDGIILTNPSNPSGYVWSKEEVLKLQQISSSAGCLLICDECYVDMVFEKPMYSPIQDGLSENTVVSPHIYLPNFGPPSAFFEFGQTFVLGFCIGLPCFTLIFMHRQI